jgi:hypothetical protein
MTTGPVTGPYLLHRRVLHPAPGQISRWNAASMIH